jgi:hypothetical protein
MTIKGILTLFRLLLLVSAAIHAKPPANTQELQANAAFARLKTLAGDWESVGPNGEHSYLNYQVISAGTAVMERFTSDALPHKSGSMITLYYIDEGQLVLTHYCIAGNQPHLRATRYDEQSGELDFDFIDGGNIVSGEEGHMHSARMRFIDEDHLRSEWQFMQARSPKFTELLQFQRRK